jgi:hypothetical protein
MGVYSIMPFLGPTIGPVVSVRHGHTRERTDSRRAVASFRRPPNGSGSARSSPPLLAFSPSSPPSSCRRRTHLFFCVAAPLDFPNTPAWCIAANMTWPSPFIQNSCS